jgi:NADH-quinone oxidoreductase subunit M
VILALIIFLPLAGAVIAALLGTSKLAVRVVSLAALVIDLVLALAVAAFGGPWTTARGGEGFAVEQRAPWIPSFGISFHLGMDGLSLVMVLLTLVIGCLAVLASWSEIEERVAFFHVSLLAVLTGVLGVFLALDLFLFAFFWEVMLVPMYFLIGIWGHERRIYAAMKFFVFTQASGLFMILAIIATALLRARATGVLSFDYADLVPAVVAPGTAMLLMLGFFLAFAVKLPVVPLHTWLPDAHTEAPTAGSLILAALMLKTGAYGILRFCIPLFPEASFAFAPVAEALGAVGIVYGAVLAFAQHDFKRLVAYTSVSHLGFVLVGAYSTSPAAYRGVVLEMVCHGLSTGGLFVIVGALAERLHTRDLRELGGLWAAVPRFGLLTMVFALASLGLPGLGNFVAEIMILLGAFAEHPAAVAVATGGLVLATVYALAIMQRVFFGPLREPRPTLPDLGLRELVTLGVMAVLLVWLGLYPRPLLQVLGPIGSAVTGDDLANRPGLATPATGVRPEHDQRQGGDG